MLSITNKPFVLSVIMLSVVMLNVVLPLAPLVEQLATKSKFKGSNRPPHKRWEKICERSKILDSLPAPDWNIMMT